MTAGHLRGIVRILIMSAATNGKQGVMNVLNNILIQVVCSLITQNNHIGRRRSSLRMLRI